MAYAGIRVQLEPTGLEPKQSETEVGILAGVRRFAEKVSCAAGAVARDRIRLAGAGLRGTPAARRAGRGSYLSWDIKTV